MANDERNGRSDDATDRQRDAEPRRGEIIPGKGFDAGTGYGGAGADSAYRGESSYGGQSGLGGSTLGGAYQGEPFGRVGPNDDASESNAARDTDANDDDTTGFDPSGPLGGERRDPVR